MDGLKMSGFAVPKTNRSSARVSTVGTGKTPKPDRITADVKRESLVGLCLAERRAKFLLALLVSG